MTINCSFTIMNWHSRIFINNYEVCEIRVFAETLSHWLHADNVDQDYLD